MGIYWIDFTYRKKEVRLWLEAENKDEAVLLAKRYLKKGFKHIKTVCVR